VGVFRFRISDFRFRITGSSDNPKFEIRNPKFGLGLWRIAVLLVVVGCQRPARPGLPRIGYVDLERLVRLHPAWPERDSLTALIASAHESHQRPIPPFRVPPEPSLPAVPAEQRADEAAERSRMEQVIQSRVDQDLAATREKLEREVARFRETELATAEREARLEAEASEPAFQQRYQAVAARYANLIAPLQLQEVGLRPRLTDLLLLSPERRAERAQELEKVRRKIEDLEKARDAELLALQVAYQAELRASRERRLAAAAERVASYERERLAQLEATRQQQQAQIRADLERSLRLQVALPEIRPPQPGPTAESARRLAAATSASAMATMDRYHESARDMEHQLYVQRQELERLITDATRTAVLQLAQSHRIAVRFAPLMIGPDLTPRFATWLRRQWSTSS
jgi:hypothetical protein